MIATRRRRNLRRVGGIGGYHPKSPTRRVLYCALSQHCIRYLEEACDVRAGNKIVAETVVICRLDGGVEDAGHDAVKLRVNLLCRPAVSHGVLAHLETGNRNAACVNCLGGGQKAGVIFAPGKAVNAGGVATSGLEMTQNAMHISWSPAEVDEKLHAIMSNIHEACVKYGTQPDGYINYVKGANIAGFMKVAQAMLEQGII